MDPVAFTNSVVEDRPLGRSSSPQVLTKTFLLTVSPRDPVTKECQDALVRYARENTSYAYIVSEDKDGAGKLHVHAILVYDRHREKKKLQENINNRIVKINGHPTAKNGIATLMTVMYSHKWYDEYLKKESGVQVLYNHYDREEVTSLFPDEDVQEILKAGAVYVGQIDKTMINHKIKWIDQFPDDSSYESAIRYLKYRMYVKEDLMIIIDKRRLTQLAWALYEFRNQLIEPCVEEVNHGSRMSGNLPTGRY